MDNNSENMSHDSRFIQENIFSDILKVIAKYKPFIILMGKDFCFPPSPTDLRESRKCEADWGITLRMFRGFSICSTICTSQAET
ncbi:hypothetical protein AAC387_Pa11g1554 [Persea americana]